MASILTPKRLELLKATVPDLSQVLCVGQGGTAPSGLGRLPETERQDLEAAGASLGIHLRFVPLDTADTEGALGTALADGTDSLRVTGAVSPPGRAARPGVVELAAQHRVPAMYADSGAVAAGGLMSYGPSLVALYRRAGEHAARILQGTKPADLPVEQP